VEPPSESVIRLERHVAGGEVLGRDTRGRVVLARGGLPGELVHLAEVVDHRSWSRGVVAEVLEVAPERVDIECPSRLEGCGGCDWMHLEPTTQLGAKVEVAAETLTRLGGLGHLEPVAGGSVPTRHYRTTARVVGTDGRRAGFRRERSNDSVDASPCLVTHPQLQRIISAIELTTGVEVELRVSGATGAATARVVDGSGHERIGLPAGVELGDERYLTEVVAGRTLRVSAGSFFQSGPAAAELLVHTVSQMAPELDDATTVLDAYGGVGLFAATATSEAARAVVVESSPSAVADARVNLADRSAEVVQRRFEHWRHRADPFDVAIVDPSRTGLKTSGVEALISARAGVVVLISCDVAAGARDLKLLAAAGYHVEHVRVLDLFPLTHHLELVTRLVRTPHPHRVDLPD
jgi:23S rRNA (uracil1939-C5)-methyltransferase